MQTKIQFPNDYDVGHELEKQLWYMEEFNSDTIEDLLRTLSKEDWELTEPFINYVNNRNHWGYIVGSVFNTLDNLWSKWYHWLKEIQRTTLNNILNLLVS